MLEKISVPVSVFLMFDSKTRKAVPKSLVWNGRTYSIEKVGLHHTFREGRILYHVFSVATKTMFFRLVLNTDDLHWKLEEVSDGLPD